MTQDMTFRNAFVEEKDSINSAKKIVSTIEVLIELGRQRGFKVEADKDYGAGPIDVVWKIPVHPALKDITCGFIVMEPLAKTLGEALARSEVRKREDFKDEASWQEYRDKEIAYLKHIEEAAMRGIRSGMDRVCLVAENEEAAKAISGKVEWLASRGCILRLDAICLGLSMDQRSSSVITPSQKRIPKREKSRKSAMRKREAKLEMYNRPKGGRKRKEPEEKRNEREAKLDRFSRPKNQKLRKHQ